jgi:hypothetical protein
MKNRRIGALIAAAALTLTFAGTALADGSVDWTGQGITNGNLNNETCDADNPAGSMLWIFTLGGSDENVTGAELTVNGDVYTNDVHVGHIIKFMTAFYDPSGSITASVSYTGTLGSGDVNLTISHGCPDTVTTTTSSETTETSTTETSTTDTETTETSTTETSSTETTETSSTETTETSTTDTETTDTSTTATETTDTSTTATETTDTETTETTPSGSVEELTPPSTDTIATANSSTVSTGLLLVLAGILAAALVVIPAAARSRR